MGTLYLIRHGQAGFDQADYDVLSPLGAVQSQRLGAYFVLAKLGLDRLYCAPRRRHRETTAALRDGAQQAGVTLPEPLHAPAFDEFPFADILREACTTGLQSEYEALTVELGGRDPLTDGRAFIKLFRLAMQRWAAGSVKGTESFLDFTSRVRTGLHEITSAGRGRHIAVVTSAGAIAALLMHLLELSPEQMLKFCLALRNTSFTELRFRDDEVSVISVNEVPHLLDPAQRTFR
jgi:broad specificity phosphatase PhoE